MNIYAQKRLDKLNNYIKVDNIRIKYLKKYIEEINNKMNNILNIYKDKDLDNNKRPVYEDELIILTVKKNKMNCDLEELQRLIRSCQSEIKYINDHDGNCLIPCGFKPIKPEDEK